MELSLKTFTPIHIGNGEELYALDYVIHNKTYYRITQNQFLKFLGNDEKLLTDYVSWIQKNSAEISTLDQNRERARQSKNRTAEKNYNQELNIARQNFNLLKFAQKHNLVDKFYDFLKKQCDVNAETPIFPHGNQIKGALKIGNNHLYIPATSIKGSVRTALLFSVLNKTKEGLIKEMIEEQFKKLKSDIGMNEDRKRQQLDELIDQFCFYCGVEIKKDSGKVETKTNDEKFDLMKLVSFSDAILNNNSNPMGIGKVNLYIGGKQQSQTPYVEYIKEGQYLSNKFHFNIDFLVSIKSTIKNENNKSFIETNNKKNWIGITEKVKMLFNLDINDLTQDNKEEKRYEVENHILQCVYDFSQVQKESDNKWFENFKSEDATNSFKSKMIEPFDKIKNQEFMVRLGYATGFTGMTEILYLKKFSQIFKILFENIMIDFNIGKIPQNREKYFEKIPKSRRMITEQEEIKPMGWIILADKNNAETLSSMEVKPEKSLLELALEVKPEYLKLGIKVRKGIEINAKVIKSGKPNRVKLLISESDQPEFNLSGYTSELAENTIVIVKINDIHDKKGILTVGYCRPKL